MAFSLLRQGVRCAIRIMDRNSLITGVEHAKMDSAKNMVQICGCFPVIALVNTRRLQIREYSSKRDRHHSSANYASDYSSESDWGVSTKKGESEFWRRKMRTFHGIVDVNKDGVISYDDFILLADRFINLGHLCDDTVREFREVVKNIWETQWGEISPYNLVTVEQYLEDMRHVLDDKKLFKRAFAFLEYLFKAIDKDKSGEISVKEFILFFKCLGLEEQDAILAFRTIDSNADGKVTKKEFLQHGREFFITRNENRISKYFWGPLVEH